MRRYRLSDLPNMPEGNHVFSAVVKRERICQGSVSYHTPGIITHESERPHVETDQEIFFLLQGEGWLEVNGCREPVGAGDLIVIEPGEDHHLISSESNPLIKLRLHADSKGHPHQRSKAHPVE